MIGKSKIKIHSTVILSFILFWVLGSIKQFLIVLLFVTIHEIAHIITGLIAGAKFEEILITPVGERAIIKNTEYLSLYKRMLIIISGPFVSISLGLILKLFFNSGETLNFCSHANLYIGIFNLVPILPLDGGNMALQYLGKKIGVLNSASLIVKFGRIFSYVIIILGVIQIILFPFNISLFVLGIYIRYVNKREYVNITYRFYKSLISMKNGTKLGISVDIKQIMVNKHENVGRILKRFNTDYYYIMCFVDNEKIIKITQSQVINCVMERGLGIEIRRV